MVTPDELRAIRGTLEHLDEEPIGFDETNYGRIHASHYWLLIKHVTDLLAEVAVLQDAALMAERAGRQASDLARKLRLEPPWCPECNHNAQHNHQTNVDGSVSGCTHRLCGCNAKWEPPKQSYGKHTGPALASKIGRFNGGRE